MWCEVLQTQKTLFSLFYCVLTTTSTVHANAVCRLNLYCEEPLSPMFFFNHAKFNNYATRRKGFWLMMISNSVLKWATSKPIAISVFILMEGGLMIIMNRVSRRFIKTH